MVTICYTGVKMEYNPFESVNAAEKNDQKKRLTYWEELAVAKAEREEKQKIEKQQEEAAKKEQEAEKKTEEDAEKKPAFTLSQKEKSTADQEGGQNEQADALVKEYVVQKTQQLQAELNNLDVDTPEAAAITADLELLTAINEKLDNPDTELEPAVELAYQEIVRQLLETAAQPENIALSESEEELLDDPLDSSVPEMTSAGRVPKLKISRPHIANKNTPSTRPPLNIPGQPRAATTNAGSETGTSSPDGPDSRTDKTPNKQSMRAEIKSEQPLKPEQKNHTRRVANVLIAGTLGSMIRRNETSPRVQETQLGTASTPESVGRSIRSVAEKEQAVRTLALTRLVASPTETVVTPESTAFVKTELNPSTHPASLETPLPSPSAPPTAELQPVIKPTTAASESKPRPRIEPTKNETLSRETARKVEQTSTQELLKIAHDIRVDGTTVRQLYESNQIDHRGLVALVKEALKGGDVKKVYKKTRLGREAQEGRKIEMRHDDPALINDTVLPVPSQEATARTEQLLNQLHQVQSLQHIDTPQKTDEPQMQSKTIADASYEHLQTAMRKKRIATLTISLALALSGVAAIVWFLFV